MGCDGSAARTCLYRRSASPLAPPKWQPMARSTIAANLAASSRRPIMMAWLFSRGWSGSVRPIALALRHREIALDRRTCLEAFQHRFLGRAGRHAIADAVDLARPAGNLVGQAQVLLMAERQDQRIHALADDRLAAGHMLEID